MEIKDLVGGEIYYLELNLPQNNNPIWIQKWKGEGLEKKGRFDSNWQSFAVDTKLLKIRIATLEEKHWLNECIKADKFIPYEEAIKTFEQEFIVGKWYKTSKNSYVKYLKEDNIFLYASEYIHYKFGYTQETGCFRRNQKEDTFILLTDLIEIQQYLPEGHVDKIKLIEEWSKGNYVIFLKNATSKLVTLNKPYKILKKTSSNTIKILDDRNFENSTKFNAYQYTLMWFATLEEAEQFSKTLTEVKIEKSNLIEYFPVLTKECYKKPKLKIRDFTPYKPKLEKKVKLIIRKTKTIKIKQNG